MSENMSDPMNMIIDVSSMFFSGLLLLVLYTTFAAKNRKYFIIAFSSYFGLLNLYSLLYINQIKDTKLRNSIHQRWLAYIYIYNMFLSLFLIVMSLLQIS